MLLIVSVITKIENIAFEGLLMANAINENDYHILCNEFEIDYL
jgi:hypothetical protein